VLYFSPAKVAINAENCVPSIYFLFARPHFRKYLCGQHQEERLQLVPVTHIFTILKEAAYGKRKEDSKDDDQVDGGKIFLPCHHEKNKAINKKFWDGRYCQSDTLMFFCIRQV
jgi:hypothetical protein